MALTNLAVFGGAFFTPIVVGKISDSIGWEWSFYFVAIFCGLCLPVIIFFVPETAYRRSAHLNTDMASSEDIHLFKRESGEQAILGDDERIPSRREKQNAGTLEPPADSVGLVEKQGDHQDSRMNTNGLSASTPQTSYLQSLKPFNGRKTDESFWKLLIRPFPLFVHPAILWGCLIQGTMIGWTVFIGIILSALFIGPPLFWTEVNTGYTYSGAFIGAVLGFLVAGALADWSARFMTRLNNGIYEPEFRIILVIPQLVFGCTGLYGFGIICADLSNYYWIWPVVFFGLEVMGMVIGAVASALYLVDAHSTFPAFCFILLTLN
jgi:MFS family permease